jgi:quinolinate synthase
MLAIEMTMLDIDYRNRILALKRENNTVILAHNYQPPEVQDIADFIGDSLALSRNAAETDADTILFCGVHFMAETASIICPDKKVLIPDLNAGCSLASTINADELKSWIAEHPNAIIVSYVNTTAEVKALSDYCCTSSNAVKVVNSIPKNRDMLATYKNADFLVHPECSCTSSMLYHMATGELTKTGHILSTEGMMKHARTSNAKEFVIATETGIIHRMKKENPDKTFIPIKEDAICKYMKKINVEKVHNSLVNSVYEVKVPDNISMKAKLSIERMLAIS